MKLKLFLVLQILAVFAFGEAHSWDRFFNEETVQNWGNDLTREQLITLAFSGRFRNDKVLAAQKIIQLGESVLPSVEENTGLAIAYITLSKARFRPDKLLKQAQDYAFRARDEVLFIDILVEFAAVFMSRKLQEELLNDAWRGALRLNNQYLLARVHLGRGKALIGDPAISYKNAYDFISLAKPEELPAFRYLPRDQIQEEIERVKAEVHLGLGNAEGKAYHPIKLIKQEKQQFHYKKALAVGEALDDRLLKGRARIGMGNTLSIFELDGFDQQIYYFSLALDDCKAASDRVGIFNANFGMGNTYEAEGRELFKQKQYSKGLEHLEKAIIYFKAAQKIADKDKVKYRINNLNRGINQWTLGISETL